MDIKKYKLSQLSIIQSFFTEWGIRNGQWKPKVGYKKIYIEKYPSCKQIP